jgi:hypothetical protein
LGDHYHPPGRFIDAFQTKLYDEKMFLATEQLEDLLDAKYVTVGLPSIDLHKYDFYSDIDTYREALVRAGYKEPEPIIEHAYSHRECALRVGAKAVGYGIEYGSLIVGGEQVRRPQQPVTTIVGLSKMRRLAVAAHHVAPKVPSKIDIRMMQWLGYPSLKILAGRIDRWNNNPDNDLFIPPPGSI